MSYVGEDDQVDGLTIDEATIEASTLTTHLDQIEEMDATQETEEDHGTDSMHLEMLHFDNCPTEVAEEVLTLETFTDALGNEEHEEVEVMEEKPKTITIPPLRPLTIAPKPPKLPVSFKPVAGQQLLLVQGAGAGQQIKLLSTAQGLNLSGLSITKPITIKQTPKTNTISLVAPKKVVMKKVVPKTLTKAFDGKSGQQIVVLQKSDPQVKLLPTTPQTKTITLSEAQQMGILGSTKIMPHAAKQIVVNKAGHSKAIKIIPQLRSPTKILPAPQITTTSSAATKAQPQRIYLKQATTTPNATHILPGQIIQVPSGQAGQLHQINIPGKGMQYIKFITATQSLDAQSTSSPTTTVAKVATTKIAPASPVKPLLKVAKTLIPTGTTRPVASGSQLVISRTLSLPPSKPPPTKTAKNTPADAVVPKVPSPDLTMESNGIKTRKPCNCAKSQCLKLYCDCFANGEFCFMCNCMNCYNNIENEEQRQRAIKNCLERNPLAFRPKIGKGKDTGEATIRKHTKGCNCKRSGCLKNYCECYEAKIACSSNCKCMGCMNVESAPLTIAGSIEGSRTSILTDSSGYGSSPHSTKKSPVDLNNKKKSIARQASNYINGAVIEATSHCLVTIAKNAEEEARAEEATKKEIIEEFGRCLKQIIDCSLKISKF